jgi:hypothetical protein
MMMQRKGAILLNKTNLDERIAQENHLGRPGLPIPRQFSQHAELSRMTLRFWSESGEMHRNLKHGLGFKYEAYLY